MVLSEFYNFCRARERLTLPKLPTISCTSERMGAM